MPELGACGLTPAAQQLRAALGEDGDLCIDYVSYFIGSMALDARARLKVNVIVPRVGLPGILMR